MTTQTPLPRSHSSYPSYSTQHSHNSSASRPRSSSYNHTSRPPSSHSHHSHHSHHSQNTQALIPQPSQPGHLTPYHGPQLQSYDPSQAPTYSRNHSHHSSHRPSHEHDRVSDYDRDRKLEKRPTLGDTMALVWRSVVGAFDRRK